MLRILIFILSVVLVAAVATWLLSLDGAVSIKVAGWRLDVPAGAVAGLGVLLVAAVAGVTSLVKDAARLPRAMRSGEEAKRRQKGLAALTRGFEAIAEGDAAKARQQAGLASRFLKEATVVRLLSAEAARLSGDDARLGEALAGMLEAPETEFIALRGLYAKARREGDHESARRHAERAFSLKPAARWAFDAAFDLALERGDWSGALSLLPAAQKAHAIDEDDARRAKAALETALAYKAHGAGNDDDALAHAAAALKAAPGLAPAAVLAARLLGGRGEGLKAERLLEAAFAANPARALVEALAETTAPYRPQESAAAHDRLAAANSGAREADILRAQARLHLGDAAAAKAILTELIETSLTAETATLMAACEAALKGDAAAAPWRKIAAGAAHEAGPSAADFDRISQDGWRRLIAEFKSAARLAPPPLENPPAGLPRADHPEPAPALEAPEAADDDAPPAGDALERDIAAARGVA